MPRFSASQQPVVAVLLASSDAELRGELAAQLSARVQVSEAGDLAASFAAMVSEPHLVVVDLPLADSDGAGALADLRARSPHCPVVALVRKQDADLARALEGREGVRVLERSAARGGALRHTVAAVLSSSGAKERAVEVRDAILDALSEAVLVHSPTERLVRCNEVAAELLGVREGDRFAEHFGGTRAVLIAEDGTRLGHGDLAVPRVLATHRPSGAQVFQATLGATRRWLHLESRPLLNDQGEVYAVVSSVRDVTERLEASTARYAAARRQCLLFEHACQSYLVLDAAGRIIEASQSAERALRRPIVLASEAERLVHLPDRARFHALLTMVRGEGAGHLVGELRFGRGEDDLCWLEVTFSNRLDEPTVAGIVVNLRDVTERRRGEESLARLSAIVEDSGDAIVSETLGGEIISWNAAAERLFGYRAEQMIGESSLVVVPEPARAEAIAMRHGIRARGPSAPTIETTRRRKDGRIVDVAVTASPVRDRCGQLIGISWITRDITERRRLEQERRQAVERFRLGFERAAIGMAMIDHHEVVRRANPALCTLLGRSPGELVGRRAGEFVHCADLAEHSAQFARLRSGKQHHDRSERRLVRADGQVIWVLIDVVEVEGDETRPYLFAQLQDITERKRIENELAYQARHDTLTGLPNRIRLTEALEQALARAAADERAMALVFVDLDGFKVVNDQFGHSRGDRLLGEIAERLAQGAHPDDTIARLGGDEFAVVCEHVEDGAGAAGLGEAIAARFDEPFGEEQLVVRASCGVVVLAGILSADEALECADAAMYEAKADGGGRARRYERPLGVPHTLSASGPGS
ncbi:MAG: PAS domain S-box protein [Actinomycetota bacterium]|nr:PAS domain S-box protein [Actinomycetota bacterium]